MPKLTPQRAEAQRRRILDAALRCFADRGMHQTTMSDIFAASGLSAGAVYGYFASKTEIVSAVADERHEFEARLLHELSDSDDPVDRFLTDYLSQFANPDLRRATVQYWAESLSDPRLAATAHAGLRSLRKAKALVTRAQRDGLVRADIAPDVLSRLVLALLQGLVLQHCWQPNLKLETCRRAIAALLAPPHSPAARKPRLRRRTSG